MNGLHILIIGIEEIGSKLAEYIVKELPSINITIFDVEKNSFSQKLTQPLIKDKQIIIVNTYCQDLSILKELRRKLCQQPVKILNFCLDCCQVQSILEAYCIPPIASIAKILSTRVKSLFEKIEELKIKLVISETDISTIAKVHSNNQHNVIDLIKGCLSKDRIECLSIEIGKETKIEIQAIGIFHSFKKHSIKIKISLTNTAIDKHTYYIQMLSSILTTLMLNSSIYSFNLEPNLDNIIGSDEGLLTYYLSKFITLGWDFVVEIEDNKT